MNLAMRQAVRDMKKLASWADTHRIKDNLQYLQNHYRKYPAKNSDHAMMRRGIVAALEDEIFQREG